MQTRSVILGGGGHAGVLLDVLLDIKTIEIVGILDQNQAKWGTSLYGVKVLGGDEQLRKLLDEGVDSFIVGLGGARNNNPRAALYVKGRQSGLHPINVIHPKAIISKRVTLQEGVQVLGGAIINAGVRIGVNVLANTGAIIEHDCDIGDHVHIATRATLAGGVKVGARAHLGAGATIRQGIRIGEAAVVGAGAVVVSDVEPGSVVVGVPARPIEQRKLGERRGVS